jgi:hypothetical protein
MTTSAADDPSAALGQIEGVPSAVMAARDAVDAVLRDRGRRSVTAEQSAAAMLIAARASAAIEDDHDRSENDHGLLGHDQSWEPSTVRLYTELVDLARLIRVSPGQAIARAHAVLAKGIVTDEDLGRLRARAGIGERMSALNQLLTGPTNASAIVVAGIAHAELITVAPFTAGNGIIARAVEHLMLVEADIDGPAVTVPEAAHRAAGSRYQQALAGYRTGTVEGVRDWLLHVSAAVARGAELSPLKPLRRGRN